MRLQPPHISFKIKITERTASESPIYMKFNYILCTCLTLTRMKLHVHNFIIAQSYIHFASLHSHCLIAA